MEVGHPGAAAARPSPSLHQVAAGQVRGRVLWEPAFESQDLIPKESSSFWGRLQVEGKEHKHIRIISPAKANKNITGKEYLQFKMHQPLNFQINSSRWIQNDLRPN